MTILHASSVGVSFTFYSVTSLLHSSSVEFSTLVQTSVTDQNVFDIIGRELPHPGSSFSPTAFSGAQIQRPVITDSWVWHFKSSTFRFSFLLGKMSEGVGFKGETFSII